ncbi:hypothetical protein GCM10009609_51230 [Pseudonocardia aurantiaca]|uniref:Uncharacterized protein n=1 Tax=Pseudonocardia aurantiaca TaxID=75290 RepID=A0ABW4FS80_9PSEU
MTIAGSMPQVVEREGKVRFAVGSPSGPRSQSWVVAGHTGKSANRDTSNDVYVGTRKQMGLMKLSLHQREWRLAVPRQTAERFAIPLADRAVAVWPPTPEIAQGAGWRTSGMIVIPDSSLGPTWLERRMDRVTFFPAPEPGAERIVILIVGAPGAPEFSLNPSRDGGRLALPGGGTVRFWIEQAPTRPDLAAELPDVRRAAARMPGAVLPGHGFAHTSNRQGVPVLVDLGLITRSHAAAD